jgi:molybdopterin-guanine dinucleotide biosynthesis protein A
MELYDSAVADLSAFVLAGGRSSRMGRDKALLRLDGQTLLERAQELARSITEQVAIAGSRKKYGPAAIEDTYRARGPLAWIIHEVSSQKSKDALKG